MMLNNHITRIAHGLLWFFNFWYILLYTWVILVYGVLIFYKVFLKLFIQKEGDLFVLIKWTFQ